MEYTQCKNQIFHSFVVAKKNEFTFNYYRCIVVDVLIVTVDFETSVADDGLAVSLSVLCFGCWQQHKAEDIISRQFLKVNNRQITLTKRARSYMVILIVNGIHLGIENLNIMLIRSEEKQKMAAFKDRIIVISRATVLFINLSVLADFSISSLRKPMDFLKGTINSTNVNT